MDVAQVNRQGRNEAAEIRTAGRGTGQMNEYQQNMLLMKAKELAQKETLDRFANRPPTPQLEAEKNAYYQQQLHKYLSGELPMPEASGIGIPQGPSIGTITRQGVFAPQG